MTEIELSDVVLISPHGWQNVKNNFFLRLRLLIESIQNIEKFVWVHLLGSVQYNLWACRVEVLNLETLIGQVMFTDGFAEISYLIHYFQNLGCLHFWSLIGIKSRNFWALDGLGVSIGKVLHHFDRILSFLREQNLTLRDKSNQTCTSIAVNLHVSLINSIPQLIIEFWHRSNFRVNHLS